MRNNFAKLVTLRHKWGCGALLGYGLLVIALTQFACGTIFAQQTRVLLEDRKVLVTQIDISPGESYSIPKDESGAVWTALDPVLLTKKDGPQSSKRIKPGDAEVVGEDEQLVFRGQPGQQVRLIIVKPKGKHQDLTVTPFLASGSLEDASDRNATNSVFTPYTPALNQVDGRFPYPIDSTISTSDSPGRPLLSNLGEAAEAFDATMYVLWDPALPGGCTPATVDTSTRPYYTSHPSTCSSIPVPLGLVEWKWSACAINGGAGPSPSWFKNCGPGKFYQATASGYPTWTSCYVSTYGGC